jgi:uncharacterized protein YaeQ
MHNANQKENMAIKSTVYKSTINIANIDRGYYQEHAFTIARHPSETDERMMVRLVAMAMQAHQLQDLCDGDGVLSFGAGISEVSEPDAWLKDFTEQIQVWIDVGQPDEKRILKACGRSSKVVIYAYHHATSIWYKTIENKIARLKNLEIFQIAHEQVPQLALFADRTMHLQITIQEGNCLVSDGQKVLDLAFTRLF